MATRQAKQEKAKGSCNRIHHEEPMKTLHKINFGLKIHYNQIEVKGAQLAKITTHDIL